MCNSSMSTEPVFLPLSSALQLEGDICVFKSFLVLIYMLKAAIVSFQHKYSASSSSFQEGSNEVNR